MPSFKTNIIDEVYRRNFEKINDGLKIDEQFKEGLKIKKFENDKAQNERGAIENKFERNKLIFDRVLGHKNEIPGSG